MAKTIERKVKTEYDRQQLVTFLSQKVVGFTVEIKEGISEKRSLDQNRLQRKWLQEAEQQGDMTAEEYRAFCKLHFGVPILRAENEAFCAVYDDCFKSLPYERKLKFMAEPFDFAVTRLMTKPQKSQYLNAMYQHFTGLGFELTDPQGLIYEQT